MATSTPKSRKQIPRPTGSYALVLRLPSRRNIQVGKLGLVEFPRGNYIYFGSALGGLDARVAWHLGNDKKLHWHADYLSAEVPWRWRTAGGGNASGPLPPWPPQAWTYPCLALGRRTAGAAPTWRGSTTPKRSGNCLAALLRPRAVRGQIQCILLDGYPRVCTIMTPSFHSECRFTI